MSDVSPEEQERLARELAEQLRRLRVEDVLMNTLLTVSSLGYRRLGATAETREDRDLDQARLAIETMRALVPVLERFVPSELVRDFNSSVANLQLAYAKLASEARPAAEDAPAPGDAEPSPADEPGPSPADVSGPSSADVSRGQSPGQGPEGRAGDPEPPAADASRGQSPGQDPNGQGDAEPA